MAGKVPPWTRSRRLKRKHLKIIPVVLSESVRDQMIASGKVSAREMEPPISLKTRRKLGLFLAAGCNCLQFDTLLHGIDEADFEE
jgi:hypothetical protein